MIVIYRRVSRDRQTTDSQDADLERWVALHAASAPVTTHEDHFTGKTMDRPGWDQVQALINSGKLKTLVVWRLDRLGRTARGLTALFEDLLARGVNLISMREGIDLSTPAGRLTAHIMASVAQYEREVISERVTAGLAARRAKGLPVNGNHKRKGTRRASKQDLQLVRTLLDSGASKPQIARALNCSVRTVFRLIGDINRQSPPGPTSSAPSRSASTTP